jgi:hypothetical protein
VGSPTSEIQQCYTSNTKRKHKRGGKSKSSSIGNTVIDFLNMRGITSKIIEFNQHLQHNKTDIFGVVESFLSPDDKPPRLDKSYRWVGKCRKTAWKRVV